MQGTGPSISRPPANPASAKRKWCVPLAARPSEKYVTVDRRAALTAFLRRRAGAASIIGAIAPIDGGWTTH